MKQQFLEQAYEMPEDYAAFGNAASELLQNEHEGLFVSSVHTGQYYYVSDSYCAMKHCEKEVFYQEGVNLMASTVRDFAAIYQQASEVWQEVRAASFNKTVPKLIQQSYCYQKDDGPEVPLLSNMIILNYVESGDAHKILGLVLDMRYHSWQEVTLKCQEVLFCRLLQMATTYRQYIDEPVNDQVATANDESLFPLRITQAPGVRISNREKDVLKLLADGLVSKQIADLLFISEHTAIQHRKNLLKKFEAKNTPELIKKASKLIYL